ncbi:hypothetical protein [Actinokineospora sp. NPDC004072]
MAFTRAVRIGAVVDAASPAHPDPATSGHAPGPTPTRVVTDLVARRRPGSPARGGTAPLDRIGPGRAGSRA